MDAVVDASKRNSIINSFNILNAMTLSQFIDKVTLIGRQISSADIPIYINNTTCITDIYLSQDNNGKYYVNIDTIKRYYATNIKVTNIKSKS